MMLSGLMSRCKIGGLRECKYANALLISIMIDSCLPIAKLAKLAAADRMPALALTDTNNLFGALEFSEKLASSGIQPIIGIELVFDLFEFCCSRCTLFSFAR